VVILAMPCYNEADGITEFLDDIFANLGDVLDFIVIVNDCSTDSTVDTITKYELLKNKIVLSSNLENSGHGPTFVSSINQALALAPDIVITIDGDGQFMASEIREKLADFRKGDLDILECVRSNRKDPMFRKFVTYILRLFIFIRVRNRPMDSNTPLRIYRAEALQYFVRRIPQGSLIPNLRISALTRRSGFRYSQTSVESLQRRGVSAAGSTWKAKRDWLPSKRFIQFCKSALLELWRFPI
jgi:glycosyltransferase involved in cell wall biosynthesis